MMKSVLLLAFVCLFAGVANAKSDDEFKSEITSLTQRNHVMIFSKSYCPYCKRTKALFQELGVSANVVELDQHSEGRQMQNVLQTMTGQRTVPSVWIGGTFIGGHDDTFKLHNSGALSQKLKLDL